MSCKEKEKEITWVLMTMNLEIDPWCDGCSSQSRSPCFLQRSNSWKHSLCKEMLISVQNTEKINWNTTQQQHSTLNPKRANRNGISWFETRQNVNHNRNHIPTNISKYLKFIVSLTRDIENWWNERNQREVRTDMELDLSKWRRQDPKRSHHIPTS